MRTLVLGIGNFLMGDEAVGVHVARALTSQVLPRDVDVLDGGTGGFHLLSCLTDYDPVIVVDATMDGQPPGTVSVIRPRYPSDFPRSLTAHDIGLRDLVESAALVGAAPTMYLVTVSIDSIQPMETRLSLPVAVAINHVAAVVAQVLAVHAPRTAAV